MLIRLQETWVCKIYRNNARLHFHDQCLLQSASVYLCVHQPCLRVRTHRPILIVAMETECCQRSPRSKRASSSLRFHSPPGAPAFTSAAALLLCLCDSGACTSSTYAEDLQKIFVKSELNLTRPLNHLGHRPVLAHIRKLTATVASTFLWTSLMLLRSCPVSVDWIKYGASSFTPPLSSPWLYLHASHLYPTLIYFCVFPGCL